MDFTAIFKLVSALLTAGPQVLALIEAILKAFNALPAEHQTAITEAAKSLQK